MIGVVFRKESTGLRIVQQRGSICQRSGSVGRSIRTVCSGAENHHVGNPRQVDGGRQNELLVPPTQPPPFYCHRGFTARYHTGWRLEGPMVFDNLTRNGRVHSRHVARLALDLARQDERSITQLPRAPGRGLERHAGCFR
jgi:hypothetical protein